MTHPLTMYYNNIDSLSNNELNENEILKHLKLVTYVARKYAQRMGLISYYSDLIQAGNIGLIKAIKKYDKSKGKKFSTYAIYWIRKEMMDEATIINSKISIPNYRITRKGEKHTFVFSLDNTFRTFESEHESDFTEKDVMQFNDKEFSMEESLFREMLKKEINTLLLKLLTINELKLIRLRFYNNLSFSEIGKEFNLTKQRIQQKEKEIIKKLKDSQEINNLYLSLQEL